MRCIEYAQKMNFYDMYVPTLFSWKTWIWLSDSQRRLHVVCWAFLAAWHQLHTKNRHGSSVEFIFPKEFADFSKFHSLVPYTPTQDSWQAIFMLFLTLGVHRELWRDRSLDYFRDEQTQLHGGWSWTQWDLEIPLHQELLIAATATGFRTHPAGLNVGTDIAPSCILSAAGNDYCHLAPRAW